MLLKLLKLNANDAIISGATATSSSGSVTRRKICHGTAAVDVGGLCQLLGIDCSAPIETRKKYGTVSQKLTRMHETFAQFGVEEPRDVDVEAPVHDAEVVVQQALPDEQREEARNRPRDEDERAVDALEAHALLVERDREQEAEREREEDDRDREDERPDEDLEERPADERVVDDAC